MCVIYVKYGWFNFYICRIMIIVRKWFLVECGIIFIVKVDFNLELVSIKVFEYVVKKESWV